MNRIQLVNLSGGLLFGCGLITGIDSIARSQQSSIQSTIISQLGKDGDTTSRDSFSFLELAANERKLILYATVQTGVGAALACLREKRK